MSNTSEHRASPYPLGERLFSFAAIADTHLNQGEAECNSPYEVNRLANGRMRHVVHDLNTRDVAFAIHLGDLVHPVPALPDLYAAAAQRFHEQITELRHPIHLVPGNHDVGDKPIEWGPAGVVTDEFLDLWTQHFGEHFYTFAHSGCRFFIVNAQIINSGLAAEARQREWLERELTSAGRARIFVNIHYPPYLCSTDETEHYDNLAEPGRSWLLGLLETHGVEALFAGHVHNFWYNRYRSTDCYILPSTAFVRHDYSEMYRIEPGAEAGRNDAPKLGYFLVHVHEHGHVCEVVRTYGQIAQPGDFSQQTRYRVAPVHPREARRTPLGFDMRQSWAEVLEIPPGGGLDEFDRKTVRNDYPLMALWEMGVRQLRVPLRDLLDGEVRERMRVLQGQGNEFTLFSFGPPDAQQRHTVAEHGDLARAWEIGYSPINPVALAESLKAFKAISDIPVYVSKLRSKEELEAAGGKYLHLITHGFLTSETAQIAELCERSELSGCVNGIVFRLSAHDSPWQFILDASEVAVRHGCKASVHLRMSGENPAEPQCDDVRVANRLAEALLAALVCENVSVFADTFADVDRGYFVRNGVVDRRYNPRLGLHIVRNLYGALRDGRTLRSARSETFSSGTLIEIEIDGATNVLLLPDGESDMGAIPRPGRLTGNAAQARMTDLATGEVSTVNLNARGDELQIEERSLPRHPMLLAIT
jgi:3',5'-cyclic AMP phosphodiesterase CpdA